MSKNNSLKREFRLVDAVAAIVGAVIGAGIFRVPATIAAILPDTKLILLAWLVGGVLCFCGALTFAELSSRHPKTGGEYVYLREAYGKPFSFIYGWTLFLVIRAGSLAGIAYIFGEYLIYFLPNLSLDVRLCGIGCVAILSLINFLGVKYGRNIQRLFSLLKVLLLVGIIIIGFVLGGSASDPTLISSVVIKNPMNAFGMALIFILWTYGGWNEAVYIGGEVKKPEKNLPKAILLGISSLTVLYILVNWAFLHVLTPAEISETPVVASEMMRRIVGSNGGLIIAAIILLTTFGSMNTAVLSDARIGYAVGRDHPLISFLGKLHTRFRTPGYALLVNAVWVSVLIISGSFESLITYTATAFWFFMAMTGICLFVFRKREKSNEAPFKSWAYPLPTMLFIGMCLYLLVNTLLNSPLQSLIGLGIALLGVPVYLLSKLK